MDSSIFVIYYSSLSVTKQKLKRKAVIYSVIEHVSRGGLYADNSSEKKNS